MRWLERSGTCRISTTHHLYLSHTWCHGDAHDTLTNFLNDEDGFKWSSEWIPPTDSLHSKKNEQKLARTIRGGMEKADCLIILAGIFDSHRYWLEKEISSAVKCQKPILAVEAWAPNRTSPILRKCANGTSAWNGRSIAGAVRALCPKPAEDKDPHHH